MMKLMRNSKAFTLVEILIVVAILGLLAAIAVPNLMRARKSTAEDTCAVSREATRRAIMSWAAVEKKTIAEIQADFPNGAPAAILGKGVITDGFLDASEPLCPLDGTTGYTAECNSDGYIIVHCANHP